MKKLSKTAWTVLVIGFFAILLIGVSMIYSQQTKDRERLSEELLSAELLSAQFSFNEMTAQQEGLESQLSWTELQLSISKTNLRQSVESIEATDTLFEIAEATFTEIVEISSLGWSSESLAGVTCSILPLKVKVEGEVYWLNKFVFKLSREFPTSMVRLVEIIIPEVTEGQGEVAEPSAEINLSIYSYEGD